MEFAWNGLGETAKVDERFSPLYPSRGTSRTFHRNSGERRVSPRLAAAQGSGLGWGPEHKQQTTEGGRALLLSVCCAPELCPGF